MNHADVSKIMSRIVAQLDIEFNKSRFNSTLHLTANRVSKYLQSAIVFACLFQPCVLADESHTKQSSDKVSRALQFIGAGRHDDAIALLSNVHTARAYNLMARLRVSDSDEQAALQLFDQVLAAHPDSRYTRMNRIVLLFDLRRFDDVVRDVKMLRQYVSESDTPLKVNHAYGMALLKTGNPGEAKQVFSKILARDARYVPGIDGLLMVALRTNDLEAMQASMEAASDVHVDMKLFDPLGLFDQDHEESVSSAAIDGLGELIETYPVIGVGMKTPSTMRDWFALRLFESSGAPRIRISATHVPGKSIAASRRARDGISEILIELEGRSHTGEDFSDQLWSAIAFELFNLANVSETHDLNKRVGAGDVTLDEYVTTVARREYLNMLRTRYFYVKVVVPSLREQSIPTNPREWYPTVQSDFVSYFGAFEYEDFYPWTYYSRRYKRLRFPGYWPSRDQAIPLAE